MDIAEVCCVPDTVLNTWDKPSNQSTQSLNCGVGVSLAHFMSGD